MNKCISGAAGLCWLLFGVTSASGIVVTLSPMEDTTITEKTPDAPPATDDIIYTGTTGPGGGNSSSRALLRFDISASVPSNAVVTSAALALKAIKVPANPFNASYGLHRMLRAWSESAATWANRLPPPASWGANGAAADVDYSSVVSQTTNNILVIGNTYTFVSNSNMVSDVQGWAGNPGGNFGWIVICASQGTSFTERSFGSRENNSGNRPVLTVDYFLPAAAPTLTLLPPPSNGQFSFSFNAESNRSYTAEFTGELPWTNWGVLTNIAPQPQSSNLVVNDLLTGSNRLYRVRTP